VNMHALVQNAVDVTA